MLVYSTVVQENNTHINFLYSIVNVWIIVLSSSCSFWFYKTYLLTPVNGSGVSVGVYPMRHNFEIRLANKNVNKVNKSRIGIKISPNV